MKSKLIYWCAFITLFLLCLPATALAADDLVGVAYRGHIQDLGDYPTDSSWVDSPAIIGTEGQSKRIEGFEIKLTGTIPDGMELHYNVHVQNKGWLYDENDVTNWPKDGDYAGTRGESLRIEAVKIVLTDSDGKPISGYSVQYRGHVQNVGDLPADENQWIKDGDQLGTVGSSLRLEALLVQVIKTQVEPVVYDKAGTYGPATGTEVINGDVFVKADGIKLRNLHINGDLYIGTEQVAEKAEEISADTINEDQITTKATGSITTELQNVYIAYFSRMSPGTGVNISGNPDQAFAFFLPGGTQFTAATSGGGPGAGAPMQITAGSSDGSAGGVSVGGPIGSLSLLTPDTHVSLLPGCQVQLFSVLMGAPNCGVITSPTALIQDLVVQGTGATFSGPGPIQHADIQANGASFATRPGAFTVAPGVATPPTMPALPSGGGDTPTQSQPVISPSGAVAFPITMTIFSQGADAIYYTTDGSDPTTAGAQNTTKVVGASAEISVTSNITLKAIATRSGYYDSAIASASCTVPVSTDSFARTAASDNTATFSWPAQTGATSVKVQQKPTAGTSWSDSTATASLDGNSTTATITGLTSLTAYDFRLLVTGGTTPGVSNTVSVTTPQSVTGVSVNPTTATVNIGATTQLAATVAPTDATDKEVSWSSGNEAVATVDNTGKVTAKTIGTATITVTTTDVSKTADCAVTVTYNPVTKLELDAVKVPFNGETPVTAITDDQYTGTVSWKDGDSTPVATDEKFDGTKAYTATITLDAKPSYGFTGSPAFTVTGADTVTQTIDSDKKSTTITAVYNAKDQFRITNGVLTAYSGPGGVVTIPASVTAIGTSAFENCKNLTAVTFTTPSTLQTIDDRAFEGCENLSTIEIPKNVETIGASAFYYCPKLATVTFAADSLLKTIGDSAFKGCFILSTIAIPKNVTIIDKNAFDSCGTLTSVEFAAGSQLTTIANAAFFSCHLTTITNIPAGVTISAALQTMGTNNSAGFITAYAKIGGTYTYDSNTHTWTKQP
nr:leucine-rich repeat protein [uncultured Acetobacterium sp.]